MSELKSYADWQAAVQTAYDQLRVVDRYLNDAGRKRKEVMGALLNLADYCETADELLSWIESRKDMDKYVRQQLESFHAKGPIRKLRGLVK